jgi:Tol biopolymer transport system component
MGVPIPNILCLALIAGLPGLTDDARPAAEQSDRRPAERFFVIDRGTALLGPDGTETERLDSIANAAGGISPDGRWVAFARSDPNSPADNPRGQLVIRSRIRPDEATAIPQVWGNAGSSFLPLWSADSRRILICEQGNNADGSRGSAYRLHDLSAKRLTTLNLPDPYWPSDWSADGRRFLTSLQADNGALRVAWVNIDGAGKPEFITPEGEVAYGAKVSPDGRRILCQIEPKVTADGQRHPKLIAIDLVTKTRTVVDKPGHTYGYCWSSDGSQVAYTWQMPLRRPEDVDVRKTYLITCDPDGTNRRTVTMREWKLPPNHSDPDGVIIFFQVLSWWR